MSFSHRNDEQDRQRLIRFYKKYNPERLSTIDATLQEWTSDRENLFRTLVQKYGPEPPSDSQLISEEIIEATKNRMTRFYQYHGKHDKLSSVDSTVRNFAGQNGERVEREGFEDLFRRLREKYNCEEPPSSWLPGDSQNNNNNNNSNNNSNNNDVSQQQNTNNVNNTNNNDTNNNDIQATTATTAVPVSDGTYPPTYVGQQDPASQSPDRQHQNNNNVNDTTQEENFRRRLIRYFERYAPSRMNEIERTLVQYRNREDELFQNILIPMYGPEPKQQQPHINNNKPSFVSENHHRDPFLHQQEATSSGSWGTYGGSGGGGGGEMNNAAASNNNHQNTAATETTTTTTIFPATMPGLNGHTTVCYGDNLIVYGGLQAPSIFSPDVFALDLTCNKWSRVETNGDELYYPSSSTFNSNHNINTNMKSSSAAVPAPRAFHTSIMVENRMFVFGGLLSVGIEDVHYNMHNVFAHPDVLLSENAKFQVPHNARDRLVKNCAQKWPVTQQLQEQTMKKTAAQQQRRKSSILRLAAGASDARNSALFILDFNVTSSSTSSSSSSSSLLPTWCRAATTGNEPPTRCHHSATLYNDQMLIYGGYSVHSNGQLGDPEFHACGAVYSLNTNSLFWRRIETCHSPWPARWGSASALSSHLMYSSSSSSSIIGGPRWIFSGGIDPSIPQESNETWALDLKTREWKKIDRPDPEVTFGPDSVAQHAAVSFGGKFYTVGGGSCRYGAGFNNESVLQVMDERTGAWSTITDPSSSSVNFDPKECPTPRSGHTATLVGCEIIMFGGLTSHFSHFPDRTLRSNELFAYNLLTRSWRRIETGFYVSATGENNLPHENNSSFSGIIDNGNLDASSSNTAIVSPLRASTSLYGDESVLSSEAHKKKRETDLNNSRNTSLTERLSTTSRKGKRLLGVPNAVEELFDLSRRLLDDIDKPMPPPPVEPQRPQQQQQQNEILKVEEEQQQEQQNAAGVSSVMSGGASKKVFGGGGKKLQQQSNEENSDSNKNKPNFGDEDDDETTNFDDQFKADFGNDDGGISPISKKKSSADDEEEVASLRREIEELKKKAASPTNNSNDDINKHDEDAQEKQRQQQQQKEELEREKEDTARAKQESEQKLAEREAEIQKMKEEMEEMRRQMMMATQQQQQQQQQQQSSSSSPAVVEAQPQQSSSTFTQQQQQQSTSSDLQQQQQEESTTATIDDKDRQRLIRFYQKYNPTKVADVESTLQRYVGRTDRMFAQLVNRYGPEPPEESTTATSAGEQEKDTSTTNNTEVATADTNSTTTDSQQQQAGAATTSSSSNAFASFDPTEETLDNQQQQEQEQEKQEEKPKTPTSVSGSLPSPKPGPKTNSPTPKAAGKKKSPVPSAKKSPPPPAASSSATSSSSVEDQIRDIVKTHEPKFAPALPKMLEKLKAEGKEQSYLNMLKKKHGLTGSGAAATTTTATPPKTTSTPPTAKKSPPAATATTKSPVAKPAVKKPASAIKSKEEVEKELTELFKKHDPKMVNSVPALMKKAEGKENGLLGMMKKKYAEKEAAAAKEAS